MKIFNPQKFFIIKGRNDGRGLIIPINNYTYLYFDGGTHEYFKYRKAWNAAHWQIAF
jgi:hypothetical protein